MLNTEHPLDIFFHKKEKIDLNNINTSNYIINFENIPLFVDEFKLLDGEIEELEYHKKITEGLTFLLKNDCSIIITSPQEHKGKNLKDIINIFNNDSLNKNTFDLDIYFEIIFNNNNKRCLENYLESLFESIDNETSYQFILKNNNGSINFKEVSVPLFYLSDEVDFLKLNKNENEVFEKLMREFSNDIKDSFNIKAYHSKKAEKSNFFEYSFHLRTNTKQEDTVKYNDNIKEFILEYFNNKIKTKIKTKNIKFSIIKTNGYLSLYNFSFKVNKKNCIIS